ncbi:MAG: DUF86 domain-containing protein [Bacilli bacterium]|jgi:uncharacterized protein with HEPN domain
MNNKKNDYYYISKVINDVNSIIKYTKGITYDDFVSDEMLIDATMFRLVQMAENINHLSKEYRDNHKKIPWEEITGFRNKIVHEYGKTDYTIVYEIISEDIYKLKDEIESK